MAEPKNWSKKKAKARSSARSGEYEGRWGRAESRGFEPMASRKPSKKDW
jgi:hypothetical protein